MASHQTTTGEVLGVELVSDCVCKLPKGYTSCDKEGHCFSVISGVFVQIIQRKGVTDQVFMRRHSKAIKMRDSKSKGLGFDSH